MLGEGGVFGVCSSLFSQSWFLCKMVCLTALAKYCKHSWDSTSLVGYWGEEGSREVGSSKGSHWCYRYAHSHIRYACLGWFRHTLYTWTVSVIQNTPLPLVRRSSSGCIVCLQISYIRTSNLPA